MTIKKDDGLLCCHAHLFVRYCRRHIPFHDIIISLFSLDFILKCLIRKDQEMQIATERLYIKM